MERGEVHGATGPWAVIKTKQADWLRDRKVDLLVQFALERHPDLPKVPMAADLAKTEEAKKVLLLLASGSSMGRSLVAPPDLPADRTKTLRGAFDATMKDPKLRDEAAKARLELDAMPGDRLATVAASVFDAPPAVIKKAAELTARPKKKGKAKAN
jgi:tripartite-type tricarboxylate transporter receptor subunit TctC